MPKLTGNTAVMRPDTLEVVTLAEGDDLPEWADGLVGAHLLVEEEKPKRPARRKTDADSGDDDASE